MKVAARLDSPLVRALLAVVLASTVLSGCVDADGSPVGPGEGELDAQLRSYLEELEFTGRVESTLEARLGRSIDSRLAELGRLLWFDPISSLNDDNACAGCHSPTHAFGDPQPIAIGIDNNGVVGPDRTGPRNQRRSPSVINTAFYPTLMWNSRFHAGSRDPFDNSGGFFFPDPEGATLSHLPHLLTAQAFIPPTERVEVAGFDFPGTSHDIREEVLRRLNANDAYRRLFEDVFEDVRHGAAITFEHFGRAIAEFEFTQVYADAPIDRYARGETHAMTARQKQGAVLFFGKAGCVQCHAVSGESNEMFSDFEQHAAGVPQISPSFTNVTFDGPAGNEDFGLAQVTSDPADRYAFRTSPLRNVGLQSAFMHNGAFVRLDDVIRYHLDARSGAASYTTSLLPADLQGPLGPMEPVLARLDPLLRARVSLTDEEIDALVDFVGSGLLDDDARPERLRWLIPPELPSGRPTFEFQFRR